MNVILPKVSNGFIVIYRRYEGERSFYKLALEKNSFDSYYIELSILEY